MGQGCHGKCTLVPGGAPAQLEGQAEADLLGRDPEASWREPLQRPRWGGEGHKVLGGDFRETGNSKSM